MLNPKPMNLATGMFDTKGDNSGLFCLIQMEIILVLICLIQMEIILFLSVYRSCTDIICCLLFLFFFAGMVVCTIIGRYWTTNR